MTGSLEALKAYVNVLLEPKRKARNFLSHTLDISASLIYLGVGVFVGINITPSTYLKHCVFVSLKIILLVMFGSDDIYDTLILKNDYRKYIFATHVFLKLILLR
jgi:hypothetical protein